MGTISQAQILKARALMKQTGDKEIHVIPNGHMYSIKANALISVGGKEDDVTTVTAEDAPKVSKSPATPQAPAAPQTPAATQATAAPITAQAPVEAPQTPAPVTTTDAEGRVAGDETPDLTWKLTELKAWCQEKGIALDGTEKSKQDVLTKIEAATPKQ